MQNKVELNAAVVLGAWAQPQYGGRVSRLILSPLMQALQLKFSRKNKDTHE